jgi:hypothetical protein
MQNKSKNHHTDDAADSDAILETNVESPAHNVELEERKAAPHQTSSRHLVSAKDQPITWEQVIDGTNERDHHVEFADPAIYNPAQLIHFNQLLKDHGISNLVWSSSMNTKNTAEPGFDGKCETYLISDEIASTIEFTNINEFDCDNTIDTVHSIKTNRTDKMFSSKLRKNSGKKKERGVDKAIERADCAAELCPGSTASPDCSGTQQTKKVEADRQLANRNWVSSQKRYVLGSEIALAVIIAAAGAARFQVRSEKSGPRSELIAGGGSSTGIKGTLTDIECASTGTERTREHSAENNSKDPSSKNLENADPKNKENSDEDDKFKSNQKQRSSGAAVRPKIIVASTDTLVSIAEAFFYDINVAWLIADINQKVIKESWVDGKRIVELKTRQQIELPLRSDIEQFYRSRADNARVENLVTIVDQAAVDSELLSSSLGKLLAPEQD